MVSKNIFSVLLKDRAVLNIMHLIAKLPISADAACPLLLWLTNNFLRMKLNLEFMIRRYYYYKGDPDIRRHFSQVGL